jgi:hypothetical protein
MKKIIYLTLVLCLVFFMHGCNRISGEEQLEACFNGGCSERKQDKAISNYFNDLEDEQLRNYNIEGYDFDVHMNDEFGTGELIYIDMSYQLESYDYDQAFSDLDELYDKFLDAKEDIFKFDQSANIELRTSFNYVYQNLEFDVVFTKVGSNGDELLIIYMTQYDETIDEFMTHVSSYLPLMFSYHEYMEVHLSLMTDHTAILLKTTPNSEDLTLSMGTIFNVDSAKAFRALIKSYVDEALEESYVIVELT